MIHLVVGAPGPFTRWCVEAAAAILRRHGVETGVAGVGTLEQTGSVALASGMRDLVCYAIAIDDALAAALPAAARGPILAAADPFAAMAACLDQPDLSPTEAFRAVLGASVAIHQADAHPGALRLTPQDCAADPTAILMRLATHLDLALAPEEAVAIAATIAPLLDASRAAPSRPDALEAALAARAGDPRLARAMTAVLGDFAQAPNGTPAEITLDADLFLSGAPPHEPLRDPIDVTGSARFLFVGGALPLPLGEWEAEAALDVSEHATEGLYVADLVAHRAGQAAALAYKQLTLAAPGRHRVTLAFRLQTVGALVEFRLRSERAMFDGLVTLRAVRYRRRVTLPATS